MVFVGSWWFLVFFDSFGGLWWVMVVHGGSRWFCVSLGFFVVLCGSSDLYALHHVKIMTEP